jgi:hypothetical protein
MMLSLTATCGLLLLFHVIAVHGALMAGLIMTFRQFVSVVCNAVWFGSNMSTSPLGWTTIGVVAAGVWIKMDRRYDEYDSLGITGASPPKLPDLPSRKSPFWIRQYMIPLLVCPFTFVFLTSAMTFTTLVHPSTEVMMSGGSITIQTSSNNLPPLIEGENLLALPSSHVTNPQPTPAPEATDTHLSETGHIWDDMLVKAVNPVCPPGPLNSIKNNNTIRTALATYPRSGSSYTR